MYSPEAKSLYENVGVNFAPKRPLDDLSKQKPVYNPDSLTLAAQKRYQNLMQRDDTVWREHYDIGQSVANLREGKLLLLRNPVTSTYAFVKRDSKFNDRKTVGGLFQFYSTKLIAEWQSSRPERDPVLPSTNDQIEEYIAAVKVVQDHYDRKFFTDAYEQQECLSAQDFGTWVTRFRFDPEIGDITCELLDFTACRWDIRRTAEDSSYFIYESKCSTAVLEEMLNAEVAPDGDDYDTHYGLQVAEQIATQGGNVRGLGKERVYGNLDPDKNENIVTEMWLKPEMYVDIDVSTSEPTLGGKTIPKGRKLVEMFPRGMCIVGINGMQTIIGIYDECHTDHIVTGIYHRQSYRGVGKGISDAVDVKKELDNFYSQRAAFIAAHATPATAYNQDMVSEADARNIGKPRKNIPIDFSKAPDGVHSVNQAIQPIVPANVAGDIWQTDQQLRNDLQMSMQVTDFTGGMPGVDNTTATGARIGDANAEMLLVPQHRNKADHRLRCDKVIFNLFRQFVNTPKWFAVNDKNGITANMYISGEQFADIDVEFELVTNSEVPMTPFAQRDAQAQMYQFTGGAAGFAQLKQMDPEYAGELATAFGVKLSIPKGRDIARICRRRIEQAKELLEVEMQTQAVMAGTFEAMGMPMPPLDNTNLPDAILSQLNPPISPMEPYAQQKAQWLAQFLDSDEMQFAPVEMRYVIEAMIKWQLGLEAIGQGQIMAFTNAASLEANAPMMLGQQAMDRSNQQAQAQLQAVEGERQMAQQLQLKAAEAEIGEKQAQAADERSEASAQRAHARNLELEGMRQRAAA